MIHSVRHWGTEKLSRRCCDGRRVWKSLYSVLLVLSTLAKCKASPPLINNPSVTLFGIGRHGHIEESNTNKRPKKRRKKAEVTSEIESTLPTSQKTSKTKRRKRKPVTLAHEDLESQQRSLPKRRGNKKKSKKRKTSAQSLSDDTEDAIQLPDYSNIRDEAANFDPSTIHHRKSVPLTLSVDDDDYSGSSRLSTKKSSKKLKGTKKKRKKSPSTQTSLTRATSSTRTTSQVLPSTKKRKKTKRRKRKKILSKDKESSIEMKHRPETVDESAMNLTTTRKKYEHTREMDELDLSDSPALLYELNKTVEDTQSNDAHPESNNEAYESSDLGEPGRVSATERKSLLATSAINEDENTAHNVSSQEDCGKIVTKDLESIVDEDGDNPNTKGVISHEKVDSTAITFSPTKIYNTTEDSDSDSDTDSEEDDSSSEDSDSDYEDKDSTKKDDGEANRNATVFKSGPNDEFKVKFAQSYETQDTEIEDWDAPNAVATSTVSDSVPENSNESTEDNAPQGPPALAPIQFNSDSDPPIFDGDETESHQNEHPSQSDVAKEVQYADGDGDSTSHLDTQMSNEKAETGDVNMEGNKTNVADVVNTTEVRSHSVNMDPSKSSNESEGNKNISYSPSRASTENKAAETLQHYRTFEPGDVECAKDKPSDLSCSVVTWNLAEESPSEEEAQFLRHLRGHDIVLISGQECENIKPRRTEGRRSREFRRLMIKNMGSNYVPLALHMLGGIQFGLFCKRSLLQDVEAVSVADVTCGIGNVFHNKGAIAAFVSLRNEEPESPLRLLFITAHMAAHVKNTEARNADFWRICSEIEAQAPSHFLPPRPGIEDDECTGEYLLESMDRIIFCGDLNYRIDLPREFVEHALQEISKQEELSSALQRKLLLHDQLKSVIAEKLAFPGFAEGEIKFAPTFKFDKGTQDYDTSHKQRIPAWTDRILFKPSGIRVLEYDSVEEACHSDHRPVYANLRLNRFGKTLSKPKKRRKRRPKRSNGDD